MVTQSSRPLRRTAAVVLALVSASLMTACMHVPARVWYNGQAMESSWQYNAFMSGERNPRTFRGLYYNSDALRITQTGTRFQPFGDW
jgi:hypothetical protein